MNRRKNLSFIMYEIFTVVKKFWLQVSLFRNIMHYRMRKTVFQMYFLYILYLKAYELHPQSYKYATRLYCIYNTEGHSINLLTFIDVSIILGLGVRLGLLVLQSNMYLFYQPLMMDR
jgi:hypothetical protein